MKKIEIKELSGDSLKISREMCQYAFYPTPVDELQTTESLYKKDNYVTALFENDVPIASTSCIPLTQNHDRKFSQSTMRQYQHYHDHQKTMAMYFYLVYALANLDN